MKATDLRRGDLIKMNWQGELLKAVCLGVDSNANGAFYAVVVDEDGVRYALMSPSGSLWDRIGKTVHDVAELPYQ